MKRCGRCGADNSDGLRFCMDCGNRLGPDPGQVVEPTPPRGLNLPQSPAAAQPLATAGDPAARPHAPNLFFAPQDETPAPVTCFSCGTENPPSSRFCAACGKSLATQSPANVPANPAPAAAMDPAAASQGRSPHDHAPPTSALVAAPVVDIALRSGSAEQRILCPRCGGVNSSEMRFCQFCGARQHPDAVGAGPAAVAGAAPPEAGVAPVGHAAAPPPQEQALYAPLPAQAYVSAAPGRAPQVPTGESAPTPAETPAAARAASGGAVALSPQPAPAARAEAARLVVIAQDGTPGRKYDLADEQTDIGRDEGAILLPHDPYVSPRHARVTRREARYFIRDLDSVNRVYLRLRGPEALRHADLLLIGLEVLRFETVSDSERGLGPATERGTQVFGSPCAPRYARLCQRTMEGVTRNVYYLSRDEMIIGRESGDLVFTNDAFMSRRHAAISRNPVDNTFTVTDLRSSNGTYLAIRGEIELDDGDYLRVGQHLFRFDLNPVR